MEYRCVRSDTVYHDAAQERTSGLDGLHDDGLRSEFFSYYLTSISDSSISQWLFRNQLLNYSRFSFINHNSQILSGMHKAIYQAIARKA